MARFEIAVHDVFKQKRMEYGKLLETHYDPEGLMNEIKTGTISRGEENKKKEKLFFMISWNVDEEKIKCTQIPPQFADFLRS